MSKLLVIELNEINFDFVATYVRRGKLPVLGRLIAAHGLHRTTSEQRYEEIEPWIQWVTAHTGLSFAEHGVFRLGDIVGRDIPQIWELLEAQGMTVGAVSPMNAKNRTGAAAFFLPDPWTPTHVTGSALLRRLHRAVSDAVRMNAESRLTTRTLASLLAGLVVYASPKCYTKYLRLIVGSRRKRWLRALLLDVLLGDIFIRLTRRTRPDFATLFVNAGAHIQHHYMFNSAVYGGAVRNPAWYVDAAEDPVLDAYETYDKLIGQIIEALPEYRLMIATGLHQDPHEEATFYWRLRDHERFLRKIGTRLRNVEPRMSRDFVVHFDSEQEAGHGERLLKSARAGDGTNLFEVENSGRSLFAMLTYPYDIGGDFTIEVDGKYMHDFNKEVVFVAIKNGKHNGFGYFLDTGLQRLMGQADFQLKELPARVREALGR